MTTMGDRKTRAALNDLLEVTRRVMLPVSQDGTFWCDEVEATKMVEWTLSVRLHPRTSYCCSTRTFVPCFFFFP